MKILLFSHQLQLGGASVNAVELAAALSERHGHEVVFFGAEGPLSALVREKKLKYVPAPQARFHPSPARMIALREVVRTVQPELIYVWEYYQCLEAYYYEHLVKRVPLLVTGMMMDVNRVLPRALPTTFGTPELVDRARAAGRSSVRLLVPPVDTRQNAPGVVEVASFRARYGLRSDEFVIVSVSRFSSANDIKADSLYRLIDVARLLARSLPVHLVLVGDGPIRSELEQMAAEVNAAAHRRVITFAGALLDPRPAYEAADVVVAMGGSALRAMAFRKPVIVVGVRGFSEEFSVDTADFFYYKGMYGVGAGQADNSALATQLHRLYADPNRRHELGSFGRDFVVSRFALDKVARDLDGHCRAAVSGQPAFGEAILDGVRSAAVWLRERRWST